jgi:hypothetical protein
MYKLKTNKLIDIINTYNFPNQKNNVCLAHPLPKNISMRVLLPPEFKKKCVKIIKVSQFKGFHFILAKRFLINLARNPFKPLPMFKW